MSSLIARVRLGFGPETNLYSPDAIPGESHDDIGDEAGED